MSSDERRLVGHAARLLQPDGRRLDGLVRTALGSEGDAGRRADQDRLPPGVDPERPGLQGALDERVVHDADRQQRLSPAVPRGTELAHEADQVGLGDAQLDVLTAGLLPPVQDRLGVVGEPVRPLGRGPHADLVHPAAQVGAGADVGAHRDDAAAGLGSGPVEVEQRAAQGGLRRGGPRRGPAQVGRDLRHLGRGLLDPPEPLGGVGEQPCGRAVGREHRPGVGRVDAQAGGELADLRLVEQGRVVLWMPLGGQPVALERVGQDDGRPGVVDLRERRTQRGRGRGRRGCGRRRPGRRRARRPAAGRSRPRRRRRRAASPAAPPGSAGASAGTRGWSCRRCGCAGGRRRDGRTAPPAAARTSRSAPASRRRRTCPAAGWRPSWGRRGPATAG